jgi:hypothetical protein
MRIHKEQGTILGGVHLELTGEVNDDGFSVVRVILYGAISTLQLTFFPLRPNVSEVRWSWKTRICPSTTDHTATPG